MMGAHVNGLRQLHSRGLRIFEVKAVCDVKESLAKEKAKLVAEFQDSEPKVYTNFEEMLRHESLDAVDIALPHNVHHTVANICLEQGLDVIIEKPLGITMRAARIILEKARKNNKVLAVAENYRRSPENRAIRWALEQGLIGEPRMIVWSSAGWSPGAWGWREDKYAAGGSWVFDGGVHLADLDRYQLRKEATEVYAVQKTFEPVREGVKVTVDDVTMAIVIYEGDVYAQWLWTRAAPGKAINLRLIYGSKGAVGNDGLFIQRENLIETQSMNTLVSRMFESLRPEEKAKWFPKGITDTVATELYDFYDSVVNHRPPEVDGLEAYRDMAIPLGFYESAFLKKPVSIRDVEELRIEEYQKEINEKLGIS
ncbi:MAG: Gfo/Idh/MocA family oxidoreductase [Candidatus Brockarchaeota archaeon]|nr:Gfo/Idh/MocA family oxidoreductase [Candidatus Brockarchaeota archaeon]